jgi:glucose-6-phosphate isomerase
MNAPRITLDFTNMFADRTGGRGIEAATLEGVRQQFRAIQEETRNRRTTHELGFYELPLEREIVAQIRAFAEGMGQAFDTIVVLGIGGSALGTLALRHALRPPFWNELDDEAREYFPRLYVLDNVDPATIGPLLRRIDLRRTLFNVISKSGATAETMAQFTIVRERLRTQLGDDGFRGHVIFTTDPERGVLRQLADAEGIATLPVPSNVGGRFSVLSAVGLLPAALIGIDIDALLAGAAAMIERCDTPELERNPAGMFAALQYLAHQQRGAGIHVMMPYSDRLYSFADWYRQLWAESLGKRFSRAGAEIFTGPTPVKALGATDQHSQVQLYIEGPFDKTVTFLAAGTHEDDVAIPPAYPELDELGYLGGHSLGELLDAELNATAAALAESGRMNLTITLPRIDAHGIGELIMLLQIATVYAAGFYGVDPLDQPGVELGKQLTYGLMGRPGFQAPRTVAPDPGRVLG